MLKPKNASYLSVVVTVILTLLLISNIRSIVQTRKNIKRMDIASEKLQQLNEENANLQIQIDHTKTEEYIEKEALEKLNLTKPGYSILIINDAKEKGKSKDKKDNISSSEIQNWRLWLKRFKINID